MKILCIGDIVSRAGRECVRTHLDNIVKEKSIDLVIANGENLSHGRGMSRNAYDEMCSVGVDGFTLGNHTWNCKDIVNILSYNNNVIRPANYPASCPGKGSMILKTALGEKVGIINIAGRTYMEAAACPFETAEKEIKKLSEQTNIILVDFHAEATSEKQAMGWFLDGKVSAVYGTHTHVQTADEIVLPKGTAYITDIGMTGAFYSVLGMERQAVIEKFRTGMPQKFTVADGKSRFCGCVVEINSKGIATDIERLSIM